MPQPDNKREYGSTTQTSQSTVAPQGQMAANISPISGGAAAAAPVLQIGQQAQIKDKGTALYEAISGAAQGIQQGIQNYEQMYKLQSEKDYADFETAYIQESERVNNDPTKMKAWMDNQTYKPNRVTAKRYHSVRADINGKAYEEDQNDQWMSIQKRAASMTATDALAYYNEILPEYDENSPVAKSLESGIIKLEGNVAASTRQAQMSISELEFRRQNVETIQALHKAGFEDLSGPGMEAMFTARALGIVEIDNNGTIIYGGNAFDPNSITGPVMEMIKEDVGNAVSLQGGDYVGAAMAAANLPVSITRPRGAEGNNLSAGGAAEFVRQGALARDSASMLSGLTNSPNPEATLNQIINPEAYDNTSQYLQALVQIEDTFGDWEASKATLEELGFTKETWEANTAGWRRTLKDSRNKAVNQLVEQGVLSHRSRTSQAVSPREIEMSSRQMARDIAGVLSLSDENAKIILAVGNEEGKLVSREVSIDEVDDLDFQYIDILGVRVSDPSLGSAPLMFDDTGSGAVFRSTGTDLDAQLNTPQMRELMGKAAQDAVEVGFADQIIQGRNLDAMSQEDYRIGMSRIAQRDPMMAIRIGAQAPTPNGMDPLPLTEDKDAQTAIVKTLTEGNIASMSEDDRKAVGIYLARSSSLREKLTPRNRAFAQFSAFAPPDSSPDQVKQYVDDAHIISTSNQYTELTTEADKLRKDLYVEPGEDASAIEQFRALAGSDTGDASQRALATGLSNSYSGVTGRDIFDDLQSADDTVRVTAQSFMDRHLSKASSMGALLKTGLLTPEGLNEAVMSVRTSDLPRDPNTLYDGSGGFSSAEAQGGIALLEWVGDNRDEETKNGLARAFGSSSFEELKNRVGAGKLEDLFSDLKVIPLPETRTSVKLDNEGRRFTEYRYRIDFSELDVDDKLRRELEESSNLGLTITRRSYTDRPPYGMVKARRDQAQASITAVRTITNVEEAVTDKVKRTFFGALKTGVQLKTWWDGQDD